MSQLSIFYPLVTTGESEPLLRKKSEPIHVFDTELEDFADVLMALMYEYDGIGLAAPQLGHSIRMIALTDRKEWGGKHKNGKRNKKEITGEYIMINPKVLEYSKTMQTVEEACLSVPGVFGEVKRFQWIKVKYQNVQGKEITKKLSGFNAAIAQHEIDHLDGILFTDKVTKLTRN